MNLEDRIRSQGRATMDTFTPSPDLDDRIITHTHRAIRRRRQRATAGLVASVAAVTLGGIVLVNRDTSTKTIDPIDSTVVSAPVVASTAVTPPATTGTAEAPATTAAPLPDPVPVELPTSYFTANYAEPSAREVDLDGTVIREIPVVKPTTQTVRLPGGGRLVLEHDPFEPSFGDCINYPITDLETSAPYAPIPAGRVITVANGGVVYVVRALCSASNSYDGWELVISTPVGDTAPTGTVLASRREPTGTTPTIPVQLKVDATLGMIFTAHFEGDFLRWQILDLTGAEIAVGSPECAVYDEPAVVDSTHVALACHDLADGSRKPWVEMATREGTIWKLPIDGTGVDGRIRITAAPITPGATGEPPLLVAFDQGFDTPATVVVIRDQAIENPLTTTLNGTAAWTFEAFGLERADAAPAGTPPVAPPGGNAAAKPGELLDIRWNTPLPALKATVIADSGIGLAGGSDGPNGLGPTFAWSEFDQMGLGIATVVRNDHNEIAQVSATGQVTRSVVPANDAAGLVWDAATGPDGLLYVTRRLAGTSGTATFTLIAYEPGDPAKEVARWATTWECVEGFCGHPLFRADGVAGIDGFRYPSPLLNQPLVAPDRETVNSTLDPSVCVDDGSGAISATWGNLFTTPRTTWTFQATCVVLAEASFGSADPQADGSVLSIFDVQESGAQVATRVLAVLSPDGSAKAYSLPATISRVALVGGRLLGVKDGATDQTAGGNVEIVELTPA